MIESNQRYFETPFSISSTGFQFTQNIFHSDLSKIEPSETEVEGCVPADDGSLITARKRRMRDAALHEIISAQMWAVKVVTLK